MKAYDIMTKEVVTVKLDTPVHEIAVLMTDRRISGVPVLDDGGQVVGMVSHGDLLHRREIGTESKRKWWLKVFADPDKLAREYSKTHGLRAKDVMTRHVVSIGESTDLADVATVLERNGIKRVPVLRDGKLVGLVTRTDLVKALSRAAIPAKGVSIDNGTLHRTLTEKMRAQPWLDTAFINLIVKDGAVEIWGIVGSEDQRQALRVLIEETAGVNSAADHLTVRSSVRDGV